MIKILLYEGKCSVVTHDNEKGKMLDLMHYCVFMHPGIPFSFYDSTNVYVTRQGNDHYVNPNAATTAATPNGCST